MIISIIKQHMRDKLYYRCFLMRHYSEVTDDDIYYQATGMMQIILSLFANVTLY